MFGVLPCRKWAERVQAVMEKGGMKLADIDALLAEADQYCWGDGLAQLPEHVARLRDVKAWVTKACLLTLALDP